MAGFVKLYGSILDSSVWSCDHATRIVWITMLAMGDLNGRVDASVGGLARRAQVTREECERALQVLSSPDPDDRSGVKEGRRIEAVQGGWFLVNRARYRDLRTPAQVKTAERVRRHRAKGKGVTGNVVTPGNGAKRTEVEKEKETDPDPPLIPPSGGNSTEPSKPTVRKRAKTERPADWKPTDAHRAYSSQHKVDVDLEADGFASHHDALGSMFVDWDAAFRKWLSNRVRWNRESGSGRRGPVSTRPMQPSHGRTGFENAVIVR